MKDCFFGRRENPDLIPRKITYQAGLGENFSWGDLGKLGISLPWQKHLTSGLVHGVRLLADGLIWGLLRALMHQANVVACEGCIEGGRCGIALLAGRIQVICTSSSSHHMSATLELILRQRELGLTQQVQR